MSLQKLHRFVDRPTKSFSTTTILLALIVITSSGCQSLLTPRHAAHQPSNCDSLDACSGFTETRWSTLDGCGWEESYAPVEMPTNYPQSHHEPAMPMQQYIPNQDQAGYDDEVILEQPIRAANHAFPRHRSNVDQPIEQASYLSAADQNEKDPSLNEEVLEYTESLALSPELAELESEDARHEKQLDEISVEYLQ
ncbi:hypothetical protein [Rubripirellula obstinata]|nr:hypothetical protein [Rubripirellula obstinata]